MTILLTDKQHEAKEKLESWLNKTHRWFFQSYNEFNEYMESLIKQIKKRINISNAVKSWKTSYAEINKKRKEKIIKYYNEPSKLKNYWINYIQKYYPSRKKLLSKLIEKSKNEDLSSKVLTWLLDIWVQLDDELLAKNYLNQYISLWKNFNKIKLLLIKKEFDSNLVNNIIDTYKEELNWSLLDSFTLTTKIENLLQKWKSEYYIKQKLWDTQHDIDLINEILLELNFDNTEIIEREINKLKERWYEKQKIIQKMTYKWYKYSDYQSFL